MNKEAPPKKGYFIQVVDPEGVLYVHYDGEKSQYHLKDEKIGMCIFTHSNAEIIANDIRAKTRGTVYLGEVYHSSH